MTRTFRIAALLALFVSAGCTVENGAFIGDGDLAGGGAGADLVGADLWGADLAGGADLVGADLVGATDLVAAADLVGADLTGADLVSVVVADDLASGAPDLTGVTGDLTVGPSDLASAPIDMSPGGCIALPSGGTRVHVKAGATGTQTGSAAQPYASVAAALKTAELIGSSAVVLIGAGTYDLDMVSTDHAMQIIGGVDPTFSCIGTTPTILRAVAASQPALTLTQTPGIELSYLTLVGNGESTNSVARGALYINGGTATLRHVRIESQRDLATMKSNALGLEVFKAKVSVYDSAIVTGDAFFGGAAVKACSTELRLERVLVDNRNQLDSNAVRLDICNTSVPNRVVLDRTTITNQSVVGDAITFVSASTSRLQLLTTLVVSSSTSALSVNGTNTPELVSIASSTLIGDDVIVNKFGTPVTFTLQSSIVWGSTVFRASTLANIALNLSGTSFLYSYFGIIQSAPALPSDSTRDAAAFRAVYDPDFATSPNLRFEDPLLEAYHLTAASPAKNAATCTADFAFDIDGDPRGTICDVGADEIP